MHTGKPIHIHEKPLAGGRLPVICSPLVGRTRDRILSEVAQITAKQPDLLEWRVDFFEDIGDRAAVVDLAARLRQAAGGIPLMFTRRSIREGGEPIAVSESAVVELYAAVCASGTVDIVDFEMDNAPTDLAHVRAAALAHQVKLVLSFHDFQVTPTLDALLQRFAQAQRLGADIAKVAVMPKQLEDVLTLLAATLRASQLLEIPVVSMSMGPYGSITRLIGGAFGSAMSFAVGAASSAPGQVPIEDLKTVLDIVQRSMTSG